MSSFQGLYWRSSIIPSLPFDHFYLPRLHRKGFVAGNAKNVPNQSKKNLDITPIQQGLAHYKNVAEFSLINLLNEFIKLFNLDPLAYLQKEINPKNTPSNLEFSSTENLLTNHLDKLDKLKKLAKENSSNCVLKALQPYQEKLLDYLLSSNCRLHTPQILFCLQACFDWFHKVLEIFCEDTQKKLIFSNEETLLIEFPKSSKQ